MDSAQELIKRSPITYAANVNAPVLLLHGEADARCPVAQSEEYFVALKRLGKEVEVRAIPGVQSSLSQDGPSQDAGRVPGPHPGVVSEVVGVIDLVARRRHQPP